MAAPEFDYVIVGAAVLADVIGPGSPRQAGPAPPHFAVGITNSAPLPMLAGQRCMIDFCLV